MSVTTMPSNGSFTVNCKHCGFDTRKTPEKLNKGNELKLYFCGQCKNHTLSQVIEGIATIFKVAS